MVLQEGEARHALLEFVENFVSSVQSTCGQGGKDQLILFYAAITWLQVRTFRSANQHVPALQCQVRTFGISKSAHTFPAVVLVLEHQFHRQEQQWRLQQQRSFHEQTPNRVQTSNIQKRALKYLF